MLPFAYQRAGFVSNLLLTDEAMGMAVPLGSLHRPDPRADAETFEKLRALDYAE